MGAYSSHNYAPVYNFTSFELSHICKAHERLAVISHPYRPRSFTCYWNKTETERTNGYRNKNQHRKLTVETKTLPPPFLPGIEPATFRSRACALPLSYPRMCICNYALGINQARNARVGCVSCAARRLIPTPVTVTSVAPRNRMYRQC